MEAQKQVVLSLDVSTTNTGFALYENGVLRTYGTLSHKSKDWVERVRFMAKTASTLYNIGNITHVVVEDTYVSKNVNTVKKLCLAQGIIIGALPNAKLIQIYPTQWKSHFGLTKKKTKREEQKDTTMTIAEALTLQSITNDDEADAVLMGKYVIDNEDKYLC